MNDFGKHLIGGGNEGKLKKGRKKGTKIGKREEKKGEKDFRLHYYTPLQILLPRFWVGASPDAVGQQFRLKILIT